MRSVLEVVENDITPNDLNLCLLSVFFGGKMTQNAFNLMLKFMNFMTPKKYPANFNSLASSLMNDCKDNIVYSKILWCNNCKKKIDNAEKRYNRNCTSCNKR